VKRGRKSLRFREKTTARGGWNGYWTGHLGRSRDEMHEMVVYGHEEKKEK